MIAARLSNPTFYSLDIALSRQSGEVFGKVIARMMGSEKIEMEVGKCSVVDLEQIATLFDADSFRWPETGVYFGRPRESITRIVAYVQGPHQMNIHIRRTPFDSGGFLSSFGEAVQGCIADIVSAIVKEGMNIIITGASGVGKTRFMRTYVWKLFYNQYAPVLYIETVPEMAHYFREHYPVGTYVSVYPTGLAPHSVFPRDVIDNAVLYARTSGIRGVVFQESQFVGSGKEFEGYGSAEHIRGLVSSGVPYVTTMHPNTRRPEEAVEDYRDMLGNFIGETTAISLGNDEISLLYVTSKYLMTFFRARRQVGKGVEEPYMDTSTALPSSVRNILLSVIERKNTGGRK